jgi:hypothetical protein
MSQQLPSIFLGVRLFGFLASFAALARAQKKDFPR